MSTIPPPADRLGKRLFDALKECAGHTRRRTPYFFREQSMKQLARFGMVDQREGASGYFATQWGLAVAEGKDAVVPAPQSEHLGVISPAEREAVRVAVEARVMEVVPKFTTAGHLLAAATLLAYQEVACELSIQGRPDIEQLRSRIVALETEGQGLLELIGDCYQFAGAVGAPVRFLDALSRPQEPRAELLPVSLGECSEFQRLQTEIFHSVPDDFKQPNALESIRSYTARLEAENQQLQKSLATQPTREEAWIPVEDRLPILNGTQRKPNAFGAQVLIYPPVQEEGCADAPVAFYGCRVTDSPTFYLHGRVIKVTHWKPLPKGPDENG